MGESLAPSDSQVPPDEKGKIVIRNGGGNIPKLNKEFRNSFDKLGLDDKSSRAKSGAQKLGVKPFAKPHGCGDLNNDDDDDDDGGFRVTAAKRPNTLCPGFPFSTTAATPIRRSSSSYISSGVSCMTPVNSCAQPFRNGSLFRRPTSLYSHASPAIVPAQSHFRSVPNTPIQSNIPRKITPYGSGYQTWNHNQELPKRPASFCGIGSPGNSYTWSSSVRNGPRRPLSLGSAVISSSSTFNSDHKSLPSSVSDYLLTSSQTTKKTEILSSAQRRLSLPSAQAQLRPKLSPTVQGITFRPFTCGISPNGTPIFLGCTHLHPSPSASKPRVVTPTTSQAIQQLLLHSRNGYQSPDDKIALFFEILDSQERFAKVKFELDYKYKFLKGG